MAAFTRNSLTYVWVVLSIITVVSWWLGLGREAGVYQANEWTTAAVLLLAGIKTRLVIRHYMEVRAAPLWIQITCDAWLAGLLAMVASFYWLSL